MLAAMLKVPCIPSQMTAGQMEQLTPMDGAFTGTSPCSTEAI